MDKLIIEGGVPLEGEAEISGAEADVRVLVHLDEEVSEDGWICLNLRLLEERIVELV